MARHEGVCSPRRDPRVGRVGRARRADVRPAARGRTNRPVRRLPWVADFVRAGDDTFRRVTRRGRALGGGIVKRPESCPRVRREHERLLLPRLQRHQAAVCFERGRRAKGAPRRSGAGRRGPRERRRWGVRGAKPPGLEKIPCLGTVPFDPELAHHCDLGIPLAELSASPVGRALDDVAQQLLDRLP